MNKHFRTDADLLLSGLTWKREDAQRVLSAAKGEKRPMKKKLSVSFALIISLVLITTAVAFAIGIKKSQQYTAVSAARDALMSRYGLTQEMIPFFDTQSEEADGVTTVTFTASGSSFSNPDAIGQYTAVIDAQGNTTVSWSHDDADPASWEHADLTSPVWGAPQLEQALARYALYTQWRAEHDGDKVYDLPKEERERLFDELRAAMAPLELSIIPREESEEPEQTPAPAATPVVCVSSVDASAIARQSLHNHYALTDEMLTLFTEVQSLDAQNGYEAYTVAYMPITIENSELADWRRADTLPKKLGIYIVEIDAADGTVLKMTWSLDGTDGDRTYDETNWADAPAYSAGILPNVLALLASNKAIILRYPEDQRDWLSMEDAAAYDQAFRDAGFDPAIYNHGLHRETDITQEQAFALAREAMADGYALTDDQLDTFALTAEYLVDNGGTWRIGFWGNEGSGYVTLDAATGEIRMVTFISSAASNG